MDFTFSTDALELGALTREICDRIVTDDRQRSLDLHFGPGHGDAADDEADRVDEQLVTALGDAGVTEALREAAIAARRGDDDRGVGLDGLVTVLRELGRVVTDPTPWLAAATTGSIGVSPVVDVCGGGVASDRTRDRGLVVAADGAVTGIGTLVPGAPRASAFLVGAAGGGLRLVEAGNARVAREIPTDYRCVGSVEFAAAWSTEAEGDAAGLRRRLVLALCAHQWGVLDQGLTATAGYAGEREQFGRPIGSFQAVTQRLADAFIDVDAVRLSLAQALYATSAAESARGADPASAAAAADDALATAAFWACEAGHRVAHSVVHIHGGVGLDREYRAHRYFTAASTTGAMLGGPTRALSGALGGRM